MVDRSQHAAMEMPLSTEDVMIEFRPPDIRNLPCHQLHPEDDLHAAARAFDVPVFVVWGCSQAVA